MLNSYKLSTRLAAAFGALAIGVTAFSASANAAPLPLFPFFMTPPVRQLRRRLRLRPRTTKIAPSNCRPVCAARSSALPPAKRRARSSSTPRTPISIYVSATAKRCATASASAATASPGRARDHHPQGRMAGLDAAAGNDRAPALSAAPHGRRTGQPARRPRDVSRQHGSTASTAPTRRRPSAPAFRPAASA